MCISGKESFYSKSKCIMFTRQLQKTYLNRKKIKRYGHSIKINPFYVYKCKQCNSWHYSGIGDGKSEKVSIK